MVLSLDVLDDFSRYIVAWKCGHDVREGRAATLDHGALGLGPDPSPSCTSHGFSQTRLILCGGDLAGGSGQGMERRGAPYHPQTQGEIER